MNRPRSYRKCLVGMHIWEYVSYDKLRLMFGKDDIPKDSRTCSHCRKYQELEVHCLGMNPPRYTKHWINKARPSKEE